MKQIILITLLAVGLGFTPLVLAVDEATVFEAENMTVPDDPAWKVVDGLSIMNPLTTSMTFKAPQINFKIIARGDYAGGAWPILEVTIGAAVVGSIIVDSATWKPFDLALTVTPGTHTVGFGFANDFFEHPADRNLYLDKVTLLQSLKPAGPVLGPETVYEAESMTDTLHAAGTLDDGWKLIYWNGHIGQPVVFSGKKVVLSVIAKGEFGQGWPVMEVKIDEALIASFTVDSADWQTYTIETTPPSGSHTVKIEYINEFYNDDVDPPEDRNIYIDKLVVAEVLVVGQITLAWDASVDEVTGYKLYYGKKSRFDPSFDAAGITTALIAEKCGPVTSDRYERCKRSFELYCGCLEWEPRESSADPVVCKTVANPPDPLCDYDWQPYDNVIDIENVLIHTLTLPYGKYFFALSSYNQDNEGKYSEELSHEVGGVGKPHVLTNPQGFRLLVNSADNMTFIRNMFEKNDR